MSILKTIMNGQVLKIAGAAALGLALGAAAAHGWQERTRAEALGKLPAAAEIAVRLGAIGDEVTVPEHAGHMRWIDADGYALALDAKQALDVSRPLGQDEPVPTEETALVSRHEKGFGIIRDVMERRGFRADASNASDHAGNGWFTGRLDAYRLDSRVCTASINGDIDWDLLSFRCGDIGQAGLDVQRELIDALDLKERRAAVTVTARDGDYLEASVHYYPTGVAVVLKREGGDWRVLLHTQEAPPCSVMEKERIPVTVMTSIGGGGCFLPDGSYRNPSPGTARN